MLREGSAERVDLGNVVEVKHALLIPGLLFLSLHSVWGAGSVFSVRSINVNDGLSQSHVTCFTQDLQGFIWIGTAVGLNRYDGHQFKIYTHSLEDKASLSGDAIYALHADRQGRVWIGTQWGLDLYDPSTDAFKHFRGTTAAKNAAGLRPRAIDSDQKGRLWVTWSGGADAGETAVTRIDPANGNSEKYRIAHPPGAEAVFIHALDESRIVVIFRDLRGTSFIHGFSVTVLDPGTGAATTIAAHGKPGSEAVGSGERDISFAPAGPNSIWVGSRGNHVFRVNLDSGELEPLEYDKLLDNAGDSGLVSHVVAGFDGGVWVIPTWNRPVNRPGGSSIYRVLNDHSPIQKSALNQTGGCDFTRSFVIASQMDQAGVLWTGLSGGGMCVSDLQSGMFSKIHESSPGVRLSNDFVRSVWKSADGIVWVGTRVGVDRIDRRLARVNSYRHQLGNPGSLSNDEVTAVLGTRDGSIWVGTQAGGLNRDAGGRGVFQHFRLEAGNPKSIASDHVTALLEDRAGVLWIATGGGGLNRFHPENRTFTAHKHSRDDPATISGDRVTALLEDSKGVMWVGTEATGLNSFDRTAGRFARRDLGISEQPNIASLAEDPLSPGVVWIATVRHGLFRYDSTTQEITRYTAKNSLLPSDTVFSVVADDQGAIWAGTNRGLASILVKTGSFRIFGIDQGLQSMEFNTRACFRADDGELLLGGVGGLNTFYPRSITQNNRAGSVVITQVRTLNRGGPSSSGPYHVLFRNDGSPSTGDLRSDQRDLTFSFVALHFADPARNAYRYKLDNFDGDWRDAGASREATYTNLPPGSYTFRVKAVTSRGVWSEGDATYSFTIAQPFYRATWFFVLAAASLIGIGASAYRWRVLQLRALARKLQSEVDQRTRELTQALEVIGQQSDKLRETDALKSRFITNVSHDFRTPLSVSLGTLTDLRAGLSGPISEAASQELETVIRNERRLLRLVNQLLAIARLDSGKLRLQVSEYDLRALVEELAAAFGGVARQRDIAITVVAGDGPVLAFCDSEWMEQVLANLLLNALKFTPPGGRVDISTRYEPDLDKICLTVEDTGPGIPPEELPHIFDRFYQTERGATTPHAGIGVGLSLVKEIVDLHSGEIQVRSEVDAGSAFTILLKPGHAHFDPADLVAKTARQDRSDALGTLAFDPLDAEVEPASDPEALGDKPTLVIAEDDKELLAFLRKHLQGPYRVLEARSGTEALQLITTEIPDLVLSDVMMPGMDGNQLCREVRSNPETDFIPIILLTAQAAAERKLAGLEGGADDYIAKPFDIVELKLKIRNCIWGRARLKSRLATELALDSAKIFDPLPESADALFMRTVYDTIRARAQDESFSVEELANELAVSRMHLYRRLRAIVGKAPAEILMDYRLERTAQLLGAQSGTVSEVAYAAGFKSVSHFARRFREKYGCSPSEYRVGCKR